MANSFIASGQNMQRRPWRKSILKIGACSWRSHKQATLYRNTQCVRLVSTETPSETAPRVIFSGIQPTGVPHLGNYFGAIRPWVKFQNERLWNDELYFSVVDLHALTVPQEPKQLEEWRLDTYFALLAAGLDPKLCRIFFQSEVPGHTELMWILSTLASTGYLSRMTQWKTKLGLREDASLHARNAKSALKLGLFSYPVLQAADILLYKSTHVPIGEDQQQHVEFARTLAGSFNHTYNQVFPIPEPVISPAKRIMSLTNPTKKMSKSDSNPSSRILITDDEETIRQKFRAALTDSVDGISYDPENRPGVSNLLDILKHTRPVEISSHDLVADLQYSSLRSLKEMVADAVVKALREVREGFLHLRSNPGNSYYHMGTNQHRAACLAAETLRQVKEAMGLRRPTVRPAS